jgi:hypothetical protein
MKRLAFDDTNDDANKKRKKKQRKQLSSSPAFQDVTASVSAATFPARRLPELKQLYEQRKFLTPSPLDISGFQSSGGKTSSRHLRRRATSFQPRKRHRYPAGKGRGSTSTSEHNEKHESQAQPPNRRKQRRNKVSLIQKHSTWTQPRTAITTKSTTVRSPEGSSNTPVEDARQHQQQQHWIPTHLWHAKRFHMHDLWGWKVPLLHTNRGTRAILRLVKEHTIVQDVTWRTQIVQWHIKEHTIPPPAMIQALNRIFFNWDFTKIGNQNESSSLLVYGECMLHEIDKHPWAPIGPVTYLVKSQPLLPEVVAGSPSGLYFYIWGHAQIQDKLWESVQGVLGGLDSVQDLSCGMDVGCLELRGKEPTQCLQRGLAKWNTNLHMKLPITKPVSTVLNHSSQMVECIWTQPRDPSLPCNMGVCGIDIFASSESIRQLLLRLVIEGSACPIGLIEDGALRMESQPPLPVFPRDYPDTETGMNYWQPGKSGDLSLLRKYDYGSTGRIRNSTLSSLSVEWTCLVPEESGHILLVRGPFLKPFHDAWNGLGGIKIAEPVNDANKQKKRRKAINPVSLRQIPTPPRAQVVAHEALCDGLAQSLTLPATVLCHVDIDGPGKLEIGMPLYRWATESHEKLLLGYVCAASFSPWRGYFHGTAVVGADSILEAIGLAHTDGTAYTRRKSALGTRASLLVQVGETTKIRGTLRLLFS